MISVADLAQQLGLRRQRSAGRIEWHGPNPWGEGATDNGFWLREDGTACDRAYYGPGGGIHYYSSFEVARKCGIDPKEYEGCMNLPDRPLDRQTWAERKRQEQAIPCLLEKAKPVKKAPKIYDTRTLEERGISQETMCAFGIKWRILDHHGPGPDGREREAWSYPAPVPEGCPSRGRLKLRYPDLHNGAKYLWTGKDPTPKAFLYGLPNLQELAKSVQTFGQTRELWVLNGEVSVWVAHSCGIKAVSLFGEGNEAGPALSWLMDQGFGNIRVVADNDRKGRKAAAHLWCVAQDLGMECHVHHFTEVFTTVSGYDAADWLLNMQLSGELQYLSSPDESLLILPEANPEVEIEHWLYSENV